jgi:molybdopterin synthase catalytic subunit
MHALGLSTGPDVEAGAALDRLLPHLEATGSVGLVKAGATAAERTVYELEDDAWAARGTGLSPEDALSKLAVEHDYAVAVGFPKADLPQIAVGDAPVEDPAVEAPTLAELDLEAVDAAIAESEPIETLDSLIATVKESNLEAQAGAIATFTGRVRAKESPDDDPTEALTFEKYEGVAAERMAAIEAELEDWDGVLNVEMHHKVGRIERGEDIVFVVVLAGHREEAFEAVEAGINRLKDEVPIFKKESTVEEEFWRHERP